MVTDRTRAEKYLQSIIDRWDSRQREVGALGANFDFEGARRLGSEDRRKNITALEAEFAAVRAERDAEALRILGPYLSLRIDEARKKLIEEVK